MTEREIRIDAVHDFVGYIKSRYLSLITDYHTMIRQPVGNILEDYMKDRGFYKSAAEVKVLCKNPYGEKDCKHYEGGYVKDKAKVVFECKTYQYRSGECLHDEARQEAIDKFIKKQEEDK